MAEITLKGEAVKTSGDLPKVGEKALDFSLTANDLTTKTLIDYKGYNLVLNIFPSIDTGTCATSVRTFNKEAATTQNTKVLCISKDLPFAQARFCGAEGIENVVMLSDYKNGSFGKTYGLEITTGILETLHSRCVIVIDSNGIIQYTEQVQEIVNEPNYNDALQTLQNI